jgi:hypothetical protein
MNARASSVSDDAVLSSLDVPRADGIAATVLGLRAYNGSLKLGS